MRYHITRSLNVVKPVQRINISWHDSDNTEDGIITVIAILSTDMLSFNLAYFTFCQLVIKITFTAFRYFVHFH